LELNFQYCSKLSDVAAFGEGLRKLPDFHDEDYFFLGFQECEGLSDSLRYNFYARADFLAAVDS
jgi:hypothetical protein